MVGYPSVEATNVNKYSTYFVKRFGGRNLTKHAQILVFIQGKGNTSHACRESVQKYWWTWPNSKPSRNFYKTSCLMVGYPSDKTTDLDNCFNLFCRKVWRKEVNPTSSDTCIHSRIEPKGSYQNPWKGVEKTWIQGWTSMATLVPINPSWLTKQMV